MAIPSQAAYEANELREFQAKLREVERAPLRERQEDAQEFASTLRTDPELIAERIGWLFDGNYGYGSYVTARRVLRSRMNKEAWALITVAAVEWRTTNVYARKAYNALSASEKAHINRLIDREIRSAMESL